MKKFLLYGFPLIIWMGVIFKLSSIPSTDLPPVPPGLWLFMAHKTVHLVEYSVLAVLALRATDALGISRKQALYGILMLLFVFALLDEWHQHFVPGRHSRFIDVAGDMAYAALALYFYTRFRRF
jgi:VanZ family protein